MMNTLKKQLGQANALTKAKLIIFSLKLSLKIIILFYYWNSFYFYRIVILKFIIISYKWVRKY